MKWGESFRCDEKKQIIFIDLFSGAGGVSTGVEAAVIDGQKVAKVIAAVNHDPKAIESHAANHPNVCHFTEDIRTLDMGKLSQVVRNSKELHPNAILVLWASLECTNFSNAKGGKPRNADSRTLAEHLFRYLELDPDYVFIENVREFMSWGPLDENGKPENMTAGRDYIRWIQKMQSFGYDFDWRLLNAADFGAYTSRVRYFAQFARYGLPIGWPEPTHSRNAGTGLFGTMKSWKPVREVLNLEDEGESIFYRKKPLAEKTLERIYSGLVKFSGEKRFITKYFSGRPSQKNYSIQGPAHTITTISQHALVSTSFLSEYHGNGQTFSVDKPVGAIETKDRFSLVTSKRFIMDTQFNNVGTGIDKPMPTITANRKWHYLVNPQYTSPGASIDKPCFTLIARMDKAPPYLVTTDNGSGITIQDTDSKFTVLIKEFMIKNRIVDIKMRMLRIDELKRITGFGSDYVLKGTQGDQKKFIGNAVPCIIPKKMMESLSLQLDKKFYIERDEYSIA